MNVQLTCEKAFKDQYLGKWKVELRDTEGKVVNVVNRKKTKKEKVEGIFFYYV